MKKGTLFLLVAFVLAGCMPSNEEIIRNAMAATESAATQNNSAGITKSGQENSSPGSKSSEEEYMMNVLHWIVDDESYDPEEQVLHKYIDKIDVKINDKTLQFAYNGVFENGNDEIILAGELIWAAINGSHVGAADDWNLDRIAVFIPEPNNASINYYVQGHDKLLTASLDSFQLWDSIEMEFDW